MHKVRVSVGTVGYSTESQGSLMTLPLLSRFVAKPFRRFVLLAVVYESFEELLVDVKKNQNC